MKIKEQFFNLVNRLNGRTFCLVRNIHFYIKGYPVRIIWDGTNYVVSEANRKIFLATKVRYGRYSRGIDDFLERLARVYYLHQIQFEPDDVFVDCGANIGELGMWFTAKTPLGQYVGIEPSGKEFGALKKNVPNGRHFNCALWYETKTLEFYVAVDSADSSLIYNGIAKEKVLVKAERLDELISDVHTIKVLKVEAEGAEPEVLRGATHLLQRTKYVVVDTSPERGVSQEETTNDVVELLNSRGFDLIHKSNKRVVCIFRNRLFFNSLPT